METMVLIAGFTGVYADENLASALAGRAVTELDLSDIEGTNCYCDPESEKEIVRRIGALDAVGDDILPVRFIDSGDYHYLSCITGGMVEEPFCLLLLDNHPDTQDPAFGGLLSCGGWVSELARRSSFLKAVISVGPDGLCRVSESVSGSLSETERVPLHETAALLERFRLSDKGYLPLFVSIDKDVLSEDYARTNWSHGTMTLEELETILREVFRSRVLGVDICGEKPSSKGGDGEDFIIDREANLRIMNVISELNN